MKYHLEPLNEEATASYVDHRLRLAGCTKALFGREAIKAIHHYSAGIPRLINTICDNALFEGSLTKQDTIGPELIVQIASDLGLNQATDVAAAAPKSMPKPAAVRPAPAKPAAPPAAAPRTAAAMTPGTMKTQSILKGAGDEEIDDILGKIGN